MNFHTALLRGTKGQSQQQCCSQIKYLRWQRNAINRSSYEFEQVPRLSTSSLANSEIIQFKKARIPKT